MAGGIDGERADELRFGQAEFADEGAVGFELLDPSEVADVDGASGPTAIEFDAFLPQFCRPDISVEIAGPLPGTPAPQVSPSAM